MAMVDGAVDAVHTRGRGTPTSPGCSGTDIDVRNVLERASAARPRRGSPQAGWRRRFAAVGVTVHSHVLQIGSVRAAERESLAPEDFAGVDDSPVRCLDPEAAARMVDEIDRLRKDNETSGNVRGGRDGSSRASARTSLGRAPRREARTGDGLDPGDQGRLARGGVGGRRPTRLRGSRRDLLGRGAAGSGRPTARAGSREG